MKSAAVLSVLVFFSVLCASVARPIDRRLLDAIMEVESGGDENAVGDGGKSRGAYQISRAYYYDAVEFDPSLTNGGRTYEDVHGPGSSAYAEGVVRSYMERYAIPERLGHNPTYEDMARIHNGGPDGYKEDSTLDYWERIQSWLHRDTSGLGE